MEVQSTDFLFQQNAGDTCIMPLSYFPPIDFYRAMVKFENVLFDIHENFHKQYYFNRCEIYGANGKLKLSIPITKNPERTPLKDARIHYGQNWQTIHWRSIQAAYRRSPFFEYYESDLAPLYMEFEPEKLVDWNIRLFEIVNKLMELNIHFSFTESYEKAYENESDFRSFNSPKLKIVTTENEIQYQQVFQEKYGFIKNLSIIDLLFCEGRHAKELLLS